MLGAKTGYVTVGGSPMYYNVFGRGTEHVVLIPGLGDGLRTVKGMAMVMAWVFRAYARDHRVWVFSRKDMLEPGTTTRDMAGDLAVDTMLKTYTEKGLRRWKPFMWLVRMTGKSQSKERFLVQARSCLTHDALPELGRIQCPVLVIGGARDRVVGGAETQEAMAAAIPNSTVHLYADYGHAAYEEAKDFNEVVLAFFRSRTAWRDGVHA